jgi:hypothetical protein
MGSTIAAIALRTKTAAQCATPPPRATSLCFGPCRSFYSCGNPNAKAAKSPSQTLKLTCTANLGASSADLHNAGLKNRSKGQGPKPGAGIAHANPTAMPRAPPTRFEGRRNSNQNELSGPRRTVPPDSPAYRPVHSSASTNDFVNSPGLTPGSPEMTLDDTALPR